jgi:hypothetical protein
MPYRMYDVARPYPGEDMQVNMALTIDHGGQAWMVVACNEIRPEEMTIGCCWSDPMHNRKKHFMPSSPSAFCLRLGTERVFRHSCRAMCRNETPKMRKSQYELPRPQNFHLPEWPCCRSLAVEDGKFVR